MEKLTTFTRIAQFHRSWLRFQSAVTSQRVRDGWIHMAAVHDRMTEIDLIYSANYDKGVS